MNLIISVAGLVLCILGLVQAWAGRQMEETTRRYFITCFVVLIAYVGSNLAGQLAESGRGAGWAFATQLFIFLESMFSSLLMLLLSGFLLYSSGEKDWKKTRLFQGSLALWVVYMILLIYTQYSETIYYIDVENVYHRGPWYPVLLIPPILIMAVNLIGLIRRRSKLSARQRLAFGVYLLLPMGCMLLQMQFYGLFVIVLGTCVAALVMFTYILMDQTERFYKQEAENAQLKVDVLMAQIRPHFIYNSLVAIRSYLDEPEKAEAVLDHFAGFLRGSIDVLEETGCIRAGREFETVENYLYMEKERFGDDLTVVYEIEDMDFDLPPFSVQTLVENAVRHGIRGSETGRGTVRVKSYRTESEHVVEVWDDGAGFQEDVNDGLSVKAGQYAGDENGTGEQNGDRAHIGLSNLKKRLSLMCGGWLETPDTQEKETVVRMRIPIKEDSNRPGHEKMLNIRGGRER